METLAPHRAGLHTKIPIASEHPTQFIDVTDRLRELIGEAGIRFGFVNVQSLHTTTDNENPFALILFCGPLYCLVIR